MPEKTQEFPFTSPSRMSSYAATISARHSSTLLETQKQRCSEISNKKAFPVQIEKLLLPHSHESIIKIQSGLHSIIRLMNMLLVAQCENTSQSLRSAITSLVRLINL